MIQNRARTRLCDVYSCLESRSERKTMIYFYRTNMWMYQIIIMSSSLYLCANMFFQSHVLLCKVGTFEFCRFEVCAVGLILFIWDKIEMTFWKLVFYIFSLLGYECACTKLRMESWIQNKDGIHARTRSRLARCDFEKWTVIEMFKYC